jgi:TonB family protein
MEGVAMSPTTRSSRPAAHRAASIALLGLTFAGAAAYAQTAAPESKPPGITVHSVSNVLSVRNDKENSPEGMTSPKVIFQGCEKPKWPEEALKAGQTGTVTLFFLIGDDGTVRDGKIIKSSGSRLLDKAAYVGIAKCQFTPGTAAGKPMTSWMQMQYVWSLQ